MLSRDDKPEDSEGPICDIGGEILRDTTVHKLRYLTTSLRTAVSWQGWSGFPPTAVRRSSDHGPTEGGGKTVRQGREHCGGIL